jgi:hypothetical protein
MERRRHFLCTKSYFLERYKDRQDSFLSLLSRYTFLYDCNFPFSISKKHITNTSSLHPRASGETRHRRARPLTRRETPTAEKRSVRLRSEVQYILLGCHATLRISFSLSEHRLSPRKLEVSRVSRVSRASRASRARASRVSDVCFLFFMTTLHIVTECSREVVSRLS